MSPLNSLYTVSPGGDYMTFRTQINITYFVIIKENDRASLVAQS